MSIKNFLDSCNKSEELTNDSFTVEWSRPGVGFGGFYFYKKDGKLHCESECMSRQFVKDVLCSLVDNAVFDDEEDRSAKE